MGRGPSCVEPGELKSSRAGLQNVKVGTPVRLNCLHGVGVNLILLSLLDVRWMGIQCI